MVTEITDVTFADFLQSDKTVLVDFTAAWCGPCKMLSPLLEELSEELQSQLAIGKLDVDQNPEATQKYGIMSMPSLLIFRGGELVKQMVGFRPKAVLLQEIKSVL